MFVPDVLVIQRETATCLDLVSLEHVESPSRGALQGLNPDAITEHRGDGDCILYGKGDYTVSTKVAREIAKQ